MALGILFLVFVNSVVIGFKNFKLKCNLLFRCCGLIIALASLPGCAGFDLLAFNHANQDKKESNPSAYTKAQLFKLPEEKADVAVIHSKNSKQFPFEAKSFKLPSPRLEVNHEVRRELSNYLRNNGRCISSSLNRQETLFPVLAKIFEDEGLPEELLNLAIIESGFRAEATSPAGAVGLWQFMPGTARIYGLEVSKKVDERKDPILSSVAAARYLKELYSRFNDWYLVLAAYNAGEGGMIKATATQSRADYWALARSNKIMPETARFVPKFIAASILQKLHSRYGNDVQLAQYLDRHIVTVGDAGSKLRYAFSLDENSSKHLG